MKKSYEKSEKITTMSTIHVTTTTEILTKIIIMIIAIMLLSVRIAWKFCKSGIFFSISHNNNALYTIFPFLLLYLFMYLFIITFGLATCIEYCL